MKVCKYILASAQIRFIIGSTIIGFYKQWVLIERDGKFCVVNKAGKKVLFVGSEEAASKLFVMLATGFINEEYKG